MHTQCQFNLIVCMSQLANLLFPFISRTIKIPDSADGLGFQIRGFGPSVVHAVGRGKRLQFPPLELSGLISKSLSITSLLLWHSWRAAATPAFGVCVTWLRCDVIAMISMHLLAFFLAVRLICLIGKHSAFFALNSSGLLPNAAYLVALLSGLA